MTFIAQRTFQIEESATLASAQKARELIAAGVDVIQLTVGEPDFVTPTNIKKAAMKAIELSLSDHYTTVTGILPLKKALADFHRRYDQVDYKPEHILIGAGGKHVLYLLFQAMINPGDQVIIPTPYWVSYSEQIKLAGGQPILVPTSLETDYKIDVQQLEAAYTPQVKALIINSPNNPTGAVYSKEEMTAIGNWAIEKNIVIISDEMYYRLVYNGTPSFSMASLSEAIKNQTVLINGVAKSYAMTGWRIGYAMTTNVSLLHAMGQVMSHETSNPAAVSQYAALEAYSGPQDSVEEMRLAFEERLDIFYDLICQIKGFKLCKPNGAFYLFPDVSEAAALTGYASVKEFADALLLEAHVAVVAGEAFGNDNCIRMSYAGDTALLVEAARRIEEFVTRKMQERKSKGE